MGLMQPNILMILMISVYLQKVLFALIMDFIGLSMPQDWSYKPVKDDFEAINGWWNGNLNVQFGYGLYVD